MGSAVEGFARHYRAPWWLPGGNLQTIWAATLSRRHLGAPPRFVRERWATPDGDFIDVDHLQRPPGSAPPAHHGPAPAAAHRPHRHAR